MIFSSGRPCGQADDNALNGSGGAADSPFPGERQSLSRKTAEDRRKQAAAKTNPALGIETAGYFYLRNARNCYDRWGALGKVKQLDELYPRLREERTTASSATTGSRLRFKRPIPSSSSSCCRFFLT